MNWLPWLVLLGMLVVGCDRERSEREKRAHAKWKRLAEEYGAPPQSDGDGALDRPYPTIVLTADATYLRGEKLPEIPTVMRMAERVKKGGDAGAAGAWVLWSVPEVAVDRLARFVEVLRMAADDPAIRLAVDASADDGEQTIEGVDLAPIDNPELSAGNEFAVHAPGQTSVSEFLGTFRSRRRAGDAGIEQFSK